MNVHMLFRQLIHRIRPADSMSVLEPIFPEKHSPLAYSRNDKQGLYLAAVIRRAERATCGRTHLSFANLHGKAKKTALLLAGFSA